MVIKSEKIRLALARFVSEGDTRATLDFFEAIERASGYPSARPNFELAAAVGAELAQKNMSHAQLQEFLEHKSPYFVRIGLFCLAERACQAKNLRTALAPIGQIDLGHHDVRIAAADCLSYVLSQRPEECSQALRVFMDGFLHSCIALDALTRPDILTRLPDDSILLDYFSDAFELADAASRADDRSQGCRLLRNELPVRLASAAKRFSSIVEFVRIRMDRKRPETRELLRSTVDALRRSKLSDPKASHLLAELDAHAPPARDPSRIVRGTRNRSRGRRL